MQEMTKDMNKVIDTIISCTKKIHKKAALKMIDNFIIKHSYSNKKVLIYFLNYSFKKIPKNTLDSSFNFNKLDNKIVFSATPIRL